MAKFNYEKEMRKLAKEEAFQEKIEAKLQAENPDCRENWEEWKEYQRLAAFC